MSEICQIVSESVISGHLEVRFCQEGVRLGQESVRWCREVFRCFLEGVRTVLDDVLWRLDGVRWCLDGVRVLDSFRKVLVFARNVSDSVMNFFQIV